MMGDEVTQQVQPITSKELYQRKDPAIWKVIEHKQSGKQPTLQNRQRAPPDLRSLLRKWKKLDVGKTESFAAEVAQLYNLIFLKNFIGQYSGSYMKKWDIWEQKESST